MGTEKGREYWLQDGRQTQVTDTVRKHAEAAWKAEPPVNVRFSSEEMRRALQACDYVSGLPLADLPKDEFFRRRTAEQILSEGPIKSCSDYAVAFRALMISAGVPVSYLETFHEEYLLGSDFHTHSFARVFESGRQVIVDPMKKCRHLKEADIFPYIIAAEGLDCWDLGLASYDDLHAFREAHLKELTEKYERMKKAKST